MCYGTDREGWCGPYFMSVLPNPQVLDQLWQLAQTLGQTLGLEIVDIAYKTHTRPATLRVDIRHPDHPTGLEDCAQLSRLLDTELETKDWFTGPFILEVSSPGIDRKLTTEREFTVFRGFEVRVTGYGPIQGQKVWEGQLLKRDATTLQITQQGRVVTLALNQIATVQLVG